MRRTFISTACLAVALLLIPSQSSAQFNGFNTRGDYGLQSASQPPPGWYLIAPMYVRYDTDVFKDSNGDVFLPDERDSLGVNAYVLGLINARYLWDFGARTSLEGGTFVLTATFPIPSVPLQ